MTAPTEPNSALPRRYGKYELLELVGRGGMAEVFRARLPGIAGFEKTLVIKRLHPRFCRSPGFAQMFIDEAKLAARVQHKNVVQVFELGSLDNGELFIAMEFIDGTDLGDLIGAARRSDQPLPVWFCVHVLVEILDALAFAHHLVDDSGQRRNIVHNDVTPENIFIARHGDVKLGDFGVAHDDTRTSDPFPGQMKGKVPYMSPEQFAGSKPDGRSDVFSAGIVLWESLTRRRLFHAPTHAETMARICGAPRLPPSRFNPEVPAALDEIVLSALQIDRDDRLASAKSFQSALLDLQPQLHGRVDPNDVREAIAPLLLVPPGPDLPDYDTVDLSPGDDAAEEAPLERPSLSQAEAARHLQSPSATGDFPKMTPLVPVDMFRPVPPLMFPPQPTPEPEPPRRPPPRPPSTPPQPKPAVTGMVRSTGSIKDGFTYTILRPDHAKEAVALAGPATGAPSEPGEMDSLFRQFLQDKFTEEPASAPIKPSRPVRQMLAAARQMAQGPDHHTPPPKPDAPNPFWVRFPNGQHVGPIDGPSLLGHLASRPFESLSDASISADQVRWLPCAGLLKLLGEELIADDESMGACTFMGTLKGHSLTAVLGELARSSATGRLILIRRQGEHIDRRELHVKEGALTATSQNRAAFALWQGLLTSPFFAQHNLPESTYTAIRIQRPVDSLMSVEAATGLVQARGLLAREQLREIFQWDNARFGLDPSVEPLAGRPTPLFRLLPRMVAQTMSLAQLRAGIGRFLDVPLIRSPEFEAEVAAMKLRTTDLERIEPLGHGYTLGESLAQTGRLSDDRYAMVLSYVLLEVRALVPSRKKKPRSRSAPGHR